MHQLLQGNEPNLKAYYRLDDGPASRVLDVVTERGATLVDGTTKVFSTVPMGLVGSLVQTTTPASVGDQGNRLTVTLADTSSTNYLGIYKTGHGGWLIGN
ncbi:MAG TPA: hypothetical protein DDY14_13420 [Chromatiaceae bacterium]|mgnify:CR=1 FL=1|jgi:hypothetical protein|nr:MAG: hypothetical protein N838_12750 [Thiohalocapsa sp. PB-PSB1]QQO56316.1 MAG: hypothetical protein N838_26085 [Thiohalocapsa sp. PB-PSB1]HBG96280.1 hypothetical protein [Chromatiaceae bacterium]HCS89043.1 hypothetical protein [Chromatiaceae bacterium]